MVQIVRGRRGYLWIDRFKQPGPPRIVNRFPVTLADGSNIMLSAWRQIQRVG